nr:hypothetical protein [Tanacetum cinerariifolium]
MPESVLDQGIQVNKELDSPLADLDPPVKEEPTKEKPQVASKVQPLEETSAQNPVSASDAFLIGEGWHAVHRPRSAGLHGRRLLTVIKKELLHKSEEKLKNNFQSGKYHFIKKRANYVDYHTAKAPSANHKFGQKFVKALTYKDKSVPFSAKESAEESDRDESNSSLEFSPIPAGIDNNVSNNYFRADGQNTKNFIMVLRNRQAYMQLEDEEVEEEVQNELGDHEDYLEDDHEVNCVQTETDVGSTLNVTQKESRALNETKK